MYIKFPYNIVMGIIMCILFDNLVLSDTAKCRFLDELHMVAGNQEALNLRSNY